MKTLSKPDLGRAARGRLGQRTARGGVGGFEVGRVERRSNRGSVGKVKLDRVDRILS